MSANSPANPQQRIEMTLQSSRPAAPPVAAPEVDPVGQVVSLPSPKTAVPLAADFLAETAQTTERETRARITGNTAVHTRTSQQGQEQVVIDDMASGQKATVGSDANNGGRAGDGASSNGTALAWDSKDPGGAPEQLAIAIPRIKETRAPDLEKTERGEIKTAPDRRGVDGNSDHLRLIMGRTVASDDTGVGTGAGGVGRVGGGGDDGAIGHLAMPTLNELARLAGLPANDHLLLEEDDATSLNAFEWKHATYFNRVADAIRRVWVGGQVLGQSDPGGHVYGFEDRLTTVEVSIDPAGNVVDLVLREPSGAAPLDEEALRSFRVAGPFPNPPTALFRGGERYSFSFGFAVNYNRSTVDLNWRPY
jgi:TonB family protein